MNVERALGIVQELREARSKPKPPMTVEDACELAAYLRATPDGAIAAHTLREAVCVLAGEVERMLDEQR